jgi:hypothetical protein
VKKICYRQACSNYANENNYSRIMKAFYCDECRAILELDETKPYTREAIFYKPPGTKFVQPHEVKRGRNDPCYCGSQRKFKHCCLKRKAIKRDQLAKKEERSWISRFAKAVKGGGDPKDDLKNLGDLYRQEKNEEASWEDIVKIYKEKDE